MPFTRSISIILFVVFLILAIAAPEGHVYFSQDTFWLTALLSLILLFMSFLRNLFLDIIVLLTDSFYIQRFFVLFYFPEEIEKNEYTITLIRDNFYDAISFIIIAELSILLGYVIYQFFWNPSLRFSEDNHDISVFKKGGMFSSFFYYYAIIFIPLLLWQYIRILVFGVGITGINIDQSWGIIVRLTSLFNSLWFLAIIALLVKDTDKKNKLLAFLIITLFCGLNILTTSKGFFIVLIFLFIIIYYFINHNIPSKFIIYGFIATIFIATIYFNAIQIMRSVLINYYETSLFQIKMEWFKISFIENLLKFSERTGGLDWLVAFIAAGRDAFPSYVGLVGELKGIIDSFFPNTFFPGGLLGTKNNIPISKLIPIILKDQTMYYIIGSGDNLSFMGMTYLYFGHVYSIIFISLWSLLTFIVMFSKANLIIKILYFYIFVFSFFVGGLINTSVRSFYESILVYFIFYMLAKYRNHKLNYAGY
ncbi:MAG: O-antigen polymerase [Thermodesulfobacteriota bacterium]